MSYSYTDDVNQNEKVLEDQFNETRTNLNTERTNRPESEYEVYYDLPHVIVQNAETIAEYPESALDSRNNHDSLFCPTSEWYMYASFDDCK